MHLWTGNTIPKNENETYEILKMYRDSDELISWSIIENISKKFIGTYWIVIPQDNEERRIIPGEAQRIGKEYWRMGYTKEARKLIYDFSFLKLKVEEVHAQAWKNNI
ncbi:GNAT family N-acetyltransferase, partial [Bacillus sp. JJ722]|uniref:GNAT family N-acetyltransferase n=1 Tax=Bacillus sp. JJ722 TaxID=3122973 RepID=UPI002FFF1F0D